MYIAEHTCAFMHIAVHTCAFLYIAVHTCAFLYIAVHTCAFLYISVHTCALMYISVHTCAFKLLGRVKSPGHDERDFAVVRSFSSDQTLSLPVNLRAVAVCLQS
jgi:hypothetical protein